MTIEANPRGTGGKSWDATLVHNTIGFGNSAACVTFYGWGTTEEEARAALIEELTLFISSAKKNILNHNPL